MQFDWQSKTLRGYFQVSVEAILKWLHRIEFFPFKSNNYKKYTHKAFVLKRYSYIRIVMLTNAIIMEDVYALSDVQIQTKIGEKIKATRLKQNITQESLAEFALISRSSVQKVESGEIKSFDTFLRILRTLGMLDEIHHLCKEEELSPSDYYDLVNSIKKNRRKRAR